MSLRVLLAGGGSIGHVSPLLALAEELTTRDPRTSFLCLGTATGLESRVLPEQGLPVHEVDRVPMPRRPGADLLRLPRRLSRAVGQAGDAIAEVQADVVVGFGGYVSMPAYLAGRRAKVPVVVHEQNAVPGLANRFAARTLARVVAVSFHGTPLPGAVFTGLPIRAAITTLDRSAVRAQAREHFGLDPDAPTLLVTGGSQGARRLNEAVLGAAGDLADAGVGVLHISGPHNAVEAPEGDPAYRVVPYVDRMDLAYAAADLALCRSGANTVAEVAAVGLPAVFVPLPYGNGEQRRNATGLLDAGGCLLVDDAGVDAAYVRDTVTPLILDRERLASMAGVARELMPGDAAARLADLVVAAAGGTR